jgi:hypothetical protein
VEFPRRRAHVGAYRVVPLGLEVEPPGVVVVPPGVVVVPLGGVVVAGGVDGEVVDGGDADGVRSAGRSPTRSVPDSVQAVSSPRLSATAQRPVSILFMCGASSLWGCANILTSCNGHAAVRRLDRVRDNYYQCGEPSLAMR